MKHNLNYTLMKRNAKWEFIVITHIHPSLKLSEGRGAAIESPGPASTMCDSHVSCALYTALSIRELQTFPALVLFRKMAFSVGDGWLNQIPKELVPLSILKDKNVQPKGES